MGRRRRSSAQSAGGQSSAEVEEHISRLSKENRRIENEIAELQRRIKACSSTDAYEEAVQRARATAEKRVKEVLEKAETEAKRRHEEKEREKRLRAEKEAEQQAAPKAQPEEPLSTFDGGEFGFGDAASDEDSDGEIMVIEAGGLFKNRVHDELASSSNFSRKELQQLYRVFRDHCPSGDIDRETFERLVSEMHRVAVQDVRRYADMVFDLFDKDRSNSISFDEYVCFLSLASKGTREEKLSVVFKTHDLDSNGVLTHEEMKGLAETIFKLAAACNPDEAPPMAPADLADMLFRKMDADASDGVSETEFVSLCLEDPMIAAIVDLSLPSDVQEMAAQNLQQEPVPPAPVPAASTSTQQAQHVRQTSPRPTGDSDIEQMPALHHVETTSKPSDDDGRVSPGPFLGVALRKQSLLGIQPSAEVPSWEIAAAKRRGESLLEKEIEATKRAEAERRAAEEARLAQEAERKRQEEALRRELEEADRKAQEERERQERLDKERKAKEEKERQERVERERAEREEREKKEKEERERKEREERERKEREERERKEREEREKKEREEKEKKEREEREKKEKEEREKKEKEERERKAREEKARMEREAEEARKAQEAQFAAIARAEEAARAQMAATAAAQATKPKPAPDKDKEQRRKEEMARLAKWELDRFSRENEEKKQARDDEDLLSRMDPHARLQALAEMEARIVSEMSKGSDNDNDAAILEAMATTNPQAYAALQRDRMEQRENQQRRLRELQAERARVRTALDNQEAGKKAGPQVIELSQADYILSMIQAGLGQDDEQEDSRGRLFHIDSDGNRAYRTGDAPPAGSATPTQTRLEQVAQRKAEAEQRRKEAQDAKKKKRRSSRR